MLTHCPECQKELSTSASQCPHCGAPVNQGQLSGGGAPMAKPVAPAPGYAQPAYGQPGQQPPPQQPQSHCLRNCLIFGCLLALLCAVAVVALPVYMVKKLKGSVTTDPVVAASIGQKVAPGATAPSGYSTKFAIDFNMFGKKAQAAFITNGKGSQVDPNVDTCIGWGAMDQKQNSKQLQQSFQQALAARKGQTAPATGTEETGTKPSEGPTEEQVELTIAGEKTQVLHMITIDQHSGRKQSCYFVVLDGWKNEFGWLGIGAIGPEDKFDLEGFKAFLASLKK